MSPQPRPQSHTSGADEGDDDDYTKRIKNSGCFREHEALQDCHFNKKDWRACKAEMLAFRKCYERHRKQQLDEGKGSTGWG
ncbi:uncharacterized protein SPPG_09132 [Spizellomyces punctatus DAOM BR117]|uniref:CHCH domain-containing protein n=1 Tax=Spizellomyces punctatus (strain DAOM BR117) TaxID=645134 RepID=A0A0L0HLW3_SPIPD|nr:uncharacterized protein SPPG_09132 [Spizellomyces punctatus DAOM BR117]KND01905.1 hypothetical protein SPPG_09132 [Spizellomyces punctatus DAOM BR117]|eukprot:XP_016609944.1 hypothetical protein SPPG_09132 [Spizellomyces punctatus DAOM BR117]